jgi:hypothetical protein
MHSHEGVSKETNSFQECLYALYSARILQAGAALEACFKSFAGHQKIDRKYALFDDSLSAEVAYHRRTGAL